MRPGRRLKIAVVGGGVAGLTAAWLLDGDHDVVLVEQDERLGGHASSIVVDVGGRQVAVDLAAQFVTPSMQPDYWRLARDVLDVDFVRTSARMQIVGPRGPSLDVARPYRTPVASAAFAALLRASRAHFQGGDFQGAGDGNITLEEFVRRRLRRIPDRTLEAVVYPWVAASSNCVVSLAKQSSARAVLAFLARPAASGRSAGITNYNAVGGLGGVMDRLRSRLGNTDVRTSTEIVRWTRDDGLIRLTAANGWSGSFDSVVLAIPPAAARSLLTDAAGFEETVRVLDDFKEIRAELAIHTDPAYMPTRRSDWSPIIAAHYGDYCEMSIWYGGLQRDLRDLPIFKSWVTFRPKRPAEVVATAVYDHHFLSPSVLGAQERLAALQGSNGVWFAGSHTCDVDSQQSAVASAVRIAERLAPNSPNLSLLRPGSR